MKTIVIVLAVAVLALCGYYAWKATATPDPNAGDRTKVSRTFDTAEQQRLDTVTVTAADLARATCEDGAPCQIAVDGVVYDVTGLPSWARGRHHGVEAGTDATEKFIASAHGRDRLQQLPVVGRLG